MQEQPSGAMLSVALGESEDGDPWRIGVRSPRDPSRLLGKLAVRDAAVATSGDYAVRLGDLDGAVAEAATAHLDAAEARALAFDDAAALDAAAAGHALVQELERRMAGTRRRVSRLGTGRVLMPRFPATVAST